jgi:hypothetical protein
MRTNIFLTLAICFSAFFLTAAEWEVIAEEDGIRVMQKEVEGRSLPVFKGEGNVNENLYEILGVLRDINKGKEWMHSCKESKLIKAIGDRKFIVYNVTNAPWPVSDRDVLVESEATYDKASRTVTIFMKSIESPDVPEVDGLVRMPRLIGKFTLKSVNDKVTYVTYEIDADPGGMLPHWLVRMASKDIPYITLTNLRDRVKVMAANGTYKEAVKLYREMGDNWN